MIFFIFDADKNYSNTIVMEENDQLPEGFTKQELPYGSVWDGSKIVPLNHP